MKKAAAFIGVVLFAITILLPIVWVVLSSFKSGNQILTSPWGMPNQLHAELRSCLERGWLGSLFRQQPHHHRDHHRDPFADRGNGGFVSPVIHFGGRSCFSSLPEMMFPTSSSLSLVFLATKHSPVGHQDRPHPRLRGLFALVHHLCAHRVLPDAS